MDKVEGSVLIVNVNVTIIKIPSNERVTNIYTILSY
jgi:hypothetical protein